MFWGKWPSKLVTWFLTVVGAFVIVTPRIFPPQPTSVNALQIPDAAAPWVTGAGAIAVFLGATLKEIDAHKVKKKTLSSLESSARIIGELHRNLPAMTGTDHSIQRRDAVVKAAQQCAIDLLQKSGAEGDLSVTFYQLEYAETEQPEGSTPGERSNEDARLVRLGSTMGRGVEQARQEFTPDPRGKATIDRIIAKKAILCEDAIKEAKRNKWPRPDYASYLSVPVLVDGEVEGMLSCDSSVKGGLSRSMRHMMAVPASFAGTEFRASARAATPTMPTVRG